MTIKRYDALIIGGRPAGSTCARELTAQGWHVAIIDKQNFPRDKTCAGWITPAVVEELEMDLEHYAAGNVLQPITSFVTGIMFDSATVQTQYKSAVSYGILRCELDDYLLRRCGADMHLGQAVKNIERVSGQWRINGSYQAPVLIGAGGHFCPIARHLGAKLGQSEQVVAAKEVEFHLSPEQMSQCAAQAECPELYFCPDLTGYGWIFRKGPVINIGLGREGGNRGLSEYLQRFVDDLANNGRIPKQLGHPFKGHAYILYGHTIRRTHDDGVLLIGDAAGLAYAQSGEGIRPAVESAIMAAETLVGQGGSYTSEKLQEYTEKLHQRFGAPDAKDAMGWIPLPLKRLLGRMVMKNPWFVKNFVINQWFLHHEVAPLQSRVRLKAKVAV